MKTRCFSGFVVSNDDDDEIFTNALHECEYVLSLSKYTIAPIYTDTAVCLRFSFRKTKIAISRSFWFKAQQRNDLANQELYVRILFMNKKKTTTKIKRRERKIVTRNQLPFSIPFPSFLCQFHFDCSIYFPSFEQSKCFCKFIYFFLFRNLHHCPFFSDSFELCSFLIFPIDSYECCMLLMIIY